MDSSDTDSDCSSDSFDVDSTESTSLVAVVNSEASTESDIDDDVSLIKPYQFKPRAELLDSTSEESVEEDDDDENDERFLNMGWHEHSRTAHFANS